MNVVSFNTDRVGNDLESQSRLTVSFVGFDKDVEKLSAALQRAAVELELIPQVTGANVSARSQKFLTGDLVRLDSNSGGMSHFPDAGGLAIVEYSYFDKYQHSSNELYCLRFADGNTVSWYNEHQLTLVEPARFDLRAEWTKK